MNQRKNKGTYFTATVILLITSIITAIAGSHYLKMRNPGELVDRLVPQKGFTEKKLSDYFEGIKGTAADTPVFIQEGTEPGGTVLILGGTHANEPAGVMAAVVLLENSIVQKGRMIIIPFANAMGRNHTYPQDGHPQTFNITRDDGSVRTFRYGARTTNPIYEWPNPDVYIHPVSGQKMAGIERSNLNRAHPGKPDGSLTEKLAYGYLQLIKKESVDMAVDIHEASPEYPVVNAMVAHENAMELGAIAAMELESEGIKLRLEPSPKNLRGLSHREWGDNTSVLAFLLESPNPSAGRFRGKTDETLILTGEDKAYRKANGLGQLFIDYTDGTEAISERVAKHIAAIQKLTQNLEFVQDDNGIEIDGLPTFEELTSKGVGSYLNP